jgi:hypothetical protein
MLRRTLTVLTPALFALPLLLTPASQLYADADMDDSVYSGMECKYLDSYAMEGQMMDEGHVVYDNRLGIGNRAGRTLDEATPENIAPGTPEIPAKPATSTTLATPAIPATPPPGDTRQYRMKVGCPLPSLENGGTVIVGVIDGTVFDRIECQARSCVVGLGLLSGGEGGCVKSNLATTMANQGGFHPDSSSPYTQNENYITQNISWLKLEVPPLDPEDKGARNEVAEAGGRLGEVYSNLHCKLPEHDDVSPFAPNVVDDNLPQGVSYIQSYYVMDMDDDMMDMD